MGLSRQHRSFYETIETAAPMTPRLEIFLDAYLTHALSHPEPLAVLDIGCGRESVLQPGMRANDHYVGVDIHDPVEVATRNYHRVDFNEQSLAETLDGQKFDVIFCGEVIEHLFSPDALLADIRTLLKPSGIAVISTPNLAYWVNRVLLPFGISPLFLENSSEAKLGRRFGFLGQGNVTQGHIRLFTYRALREILVLTGFEIVATRPVQIWNWPVDRVICRLSPSLAPDSVFVVRQSSGQARPESGQHGRLARWLTHRLEQGR
jgi:SAM-dependent methyltransferase